MQFRAISPSWSSILYYIPTPLLVYSIVLFSLLSVSCAPSFPHFYLSFLFSVFMFISVTLPLDILLFFSCLLPRILPFLPFPPSILLTYLLSSCFLSIIIFSSHFAPAVLSCLHFYFVLLSNLSSISFISLLFSHLLSFTLKCPMPPLLYPSCV